MEPFKSTTHVFGQTARHHDPLFVFRFMEPSGARSYRRCFHEDVTEMCSPWSTNNPVIAVPETTRASVFGEPTIQHPLAKSFPITLMQPIPFRPIFADRLESFSGLRWSEIHHPAA